MGLGFGEGIQAPTQKTLSCLLPFRPELSSEGGQCLFSQTNQLPRTSEPRRQSSNRPPSLSVGEGGWRAVGDVQGLLIIPLSFREKMTPESRLRLKARVK